MRKILFRGLRVDGEGWIYGVPLATNSGHFILEVKNETNALGDNYEVRRSVRPETVGQFTGLVDRTGKDIYEGDVTEEDEFCRMSIEWNPKLAGWASMFNYSEEKEWADDFPLVEYMSGEGRLDFKVVGNMHGAQ
jgi:hypothetical protein